MWEQATGYGSGWTCRLTPGLELRVWYNAVLPKGEGGPKWEASVFGTLTPKGRRRFETAEEAKAWCERVAERHLREALGKLGCSDTSKESCPEG